MLKAIAGITIGGGGGGNLTISAGTNSVSSGGVDFLNSNGVTFGMDGAGNITASVSPTGGGGVAISAGTNSTSTGTVVFSNSNGISFGMDTNAVVTASYTVPAQTNQTVGFYALGNTTDNSSTTLDARSLSFFGGGNITVGFNNGSIEISQTGGGGQSNQTIGVYAIGNTTGQSSSSTLDARSFSIEGTNGISVGLSAGNFLISGVTTAAQTNQTEGFYAVGNTTQNSSTTLDARTVSFGGRGDITVGYSNGTIQISGTQTNQNISLFGIGNTTQNSSTVLNASNLSLNGLGIVTVGYSNGSIQVSATVAAQTNQTDGWYAVGNTTQNSSTTLDARTQSIGGRGDITVGYSNGTIQISGSQSNQNISLFALGNTTQNSSTVLNASNLSINGLGIITAGYSNGSIQLSATVAAQTNQSVGLYAVGNTTQNSSTTLDARTVSFDGLGGISVGYSNGSVQISGPQTVAQTNQSIGFYATGNTTQSSSTALDARSLTFNGLGGVTVGYSNGSIDISGASPAAGVALYDGANSITSGTARFTNANGVSFSFNGQTISASVAAQTNQSVGFYAVGNTTQNSSTTLDARTVSFDGLGGITVGYSNGSIQISGPQTVAQTNQSIGLYALGNTTQNSSTTLDARTLSFNGLGAQTVGYSNGSIQLSVPAVSSLVGVNGISISTNGSTISVSYQGNTAGSMLSYYEPAMRGGTSTNTLANGTVYIQPFVVSECVSAYQIIQLQHVSTQPTTTASFFLDVSSQTASSGTGRWAQSGTVLLFSRQSTGTAAASSNLISCGSNSYSFGMGFSASVTWSTNLLSATASITTSGAASFISNINSTGGSSTGSFGTSGTTTFSTAAGVSGTFSSSFGISLASQMFSGIRPIFCPMGTSLSPGEYWLGNIISTASASTNLSLQNICVIPGGIVVYTSNTSAYAEIGSTATIAGSNIPTGWGSYSSSGNTSTTFAISNISNMSNNQTWLALAAWTK